MSLSFQLRRTIVDTVSFAGFAGWFFFVSIVSPPILADDQIQAEKPRPEIGSQTVIPNIEVEKDTVWQLFSLLFVEVTEQLSVNQEKYLSDPVAYYRFLDKTLVDRWDSTSTSRALLGKSYYASLDAQQREALADAVSQTLIRYAYEGLENYGGQLFSVADVVVNADKGRGWVQVLVASPMFPDFNLDLLIKRNLDGVWRAVDVRVKGLTYAKIKKYEYRELFEQQGFGGLIVSLNSKNETFFSAVCEAAGDITKGAPC